MGQSKGRKGGEGRGVKRRMIKRRESCGKETYMKRMIKMETVYGRKRQRKGGKGRK